MQVPFITIKQKKKKRHPNWKGRNKTLFADEMILYVENPKCITKNYQNYKMNSVKLQDRKVIYGNALLSDEILPLAAKKDRLREHAC